MPRPKPNLTVVDPDDYKIIVLADGTTTSVEIVQSDIHPFSGRVDYSLGSGVARRRKGDPRDPELGIKLAMARAFQNAAEKIVETLAHDDQG